MSQKGGATKKLVIRAGNTNADIHAGLRRGGNILKRVPAMTDSIISRRA